LHCYICDKLLTDKEIALHPATGKSEPCSECMEEILDAAYQGEFAHHDDRYIFEVPFGRSYEE